MNKIRLACQTTVRKRGWAILASMAAIVMAHCLRTHRLGGGDAMAAVLVGLVLLAAGCLFEYIRLRRD